MTLFKVTPALLLHIYCISWSKVVRWVQIIRVSPATAMYRASRWSLTSFAVEKIWVQPVEATTGIRKSHLNRAHCRVQRRRAQPLFDQDPYYIIGRQRYPGPRHGGCVGARASQEPRETVQEQQRPCALRRVALRCVVRPTDEGSFPPTPRAAR